MDWEGHGDVVLYFTEPVIGLCWGKGTKFTRSPFAYLVVVDNPT